MHCQSNSRVLSGKGRERLHECTACKRRWRTVELLLGYTRTELPATAESALSLAGQGKTIKQIAAALHMSTRTVQQHLAAAPTLERVWR